MKKTTLAIALLGIATLFLAVAAPGCQTERTSSSQDCPSQCPKYFTHCGLLPGDPGLSECCCSIESCLGQDDCNACCNVVDFGGTTCVPDCEAAKDAGADH